VVEKEEAYKGDACAMAASTPTAAVVAQRPTMMGRW